jgi:hypothetical protein
MTCDITGMMGIGFVWPQVSAIFKFNEFNELLCFSQVQWGEVCKIAFCLFGDEIFHWIIGYRMK